MTTFLFPRLSWYWLFFAFCCTPTNYWFNIFPFFSKENDQYFIWTFSWTFSWTENLRVFFSVYIICYREIIFQNLQKNCFEFL